jgi:hypothetical protein
MNTVTIGYITKYGDLRVLATLSNTRGELTESRFAAVVKSTHRAFSEVINEYVEVFHRQDTPEFINHD